MSTEVKKYVKILNHFSNHRLEMKLSARHGEHISGVYIKTRVPSHFLQVMFQSWSELDGTSFPPSNSMNNSTCAVTIAHIFKSAVFLIVK